MNGAKVIAIAEKELGYSETPAGTNRTKYGTWFGYDGVAWCGMFVSWCFDKAGLPLGKIGFTKGFAGCQTAWAYFSKAGLLVTDPQPGDIVFFDWNGDGRYDHTGIYVKKLTPSTFETIEGNTAIGNDSNGGQVMRRVRKMGACVFARPKVLR